MTKLLQFWAAVDKILKQADKVILKLRSSPFEFHSNEKLTTALH